MHDNKTVFNKYICSIDSKFQLFLYNISLFIKAKLAGEQFLNSFTNTAIYRSLTLPHSQQSDPNQTHFPQFDVFVVICSYKRVCNLKHQLECFKINILLAQNTARSSLYYSTFHEGAKHPFDPVLKELLLYHKTSCCKSDEEWCFDSVWRWCHS